MRWTCATCEIDPEGDYKKFLAVSVTGGYWYDEYWAKIIRPGRRRRCLECTEEPSTVRTLDCEFCGRLSRLGSSWGISGLLLGASGPSWGVMGQSWAVLGPSWSHLGTILGPSWAQIGCLGAYWCQIEPSWSRLGAILRRLGPSWGCLGATWVRLGGILRRLGANMGRSWGRLEPS